VFKFAVILLIICVLFRWAFGSWPWQMLRGQAPGGRSGERTVEEARALLGVGAGAGSDEIRAAHRRLIGQVHPDRGGNAAQFHAANEARDLLLAQDAAKRAQTDQEG